MKAICVLRVPSDLLEYIDRIGSTLESRIGVDYHVITVLDKSVSELQFEVYNAANLPEVDIKQLKEELSGFNTNEK
jgi:hypothetical protein